jgi:hypothetical protein
VKGAQQIQLLWLSLDAISGVVDTRGSMSNGYCNDGESQITIGAAVDSTLIA